MRSDILGNYGSFKSERRNTEALGLVGLFGNAVLTVRPIDRTIGIVG